MFHECLALVAGVCLNQSANVELNATSLWRGARIMVEGVVITSVVQSDTPVLPDRRQMSRYCMDSECINYHINCSEEYMKQVCRVWYLSPTDSFAKELEISADSVALMNAAFAMLRVAVFQSGKLVRLAELEVRSPSRYPPICRPREDPDCR